MIDVELVEEYKPSLFTTIVPMTPRWDWMRFKVSSTSLAIFISETNSFVIGQTTKTS